ncbi:MAG: hypothetical protein WCF85_15545 [Rhodospirillaceae bacterium]
MIASILAIWGRCTPPQRAIQHVKAAYTTADILVFGYGAFAYTHEGGDPWTLLLVALVLALGIAAGYSGGGLMCRSIGLTTVRSVLVAGFAAILVAPLPFAVLPPRSAALMFGAFMGLGHGLFYLGYFAWMLRHSHDRDRDALVALSSTQGQAIQIVVPGGLAALVSLLAVWGHPAGPALAIAMVAASVWGISRSLGLGDDLIPPASPSRVLAAFRDRRSLPLICWAALLRVTMAEDSVLVPLLGATVVGTVSAYGWMLTFGIWLGLAVSCHWTMVASHAGRHRAMTIAAVAMTLTAWAIPAAQPLGIVAFVVALGARNAVKPFWGSVTTTLEMQMAGDGNDLTIMVIRDTAVGIGRILFLGMLAGIAAITGDIMTTVVFGFAVLGCCHVLVGIITPMVFQPKQLGSAVS